jgi:uncharacterized protein
MLRLSFLCLLCYYRALGAKQTGPCRHAPHFPREDFVSIVTAKQKCICFLYICCLLLCSGSSPACSKKGPAVCIEKKDGSLVCVSVETARTQAQRQLGLMYRRELPPDSGMLFFFDHEQKQAFTMKNTYIPLDMIFITSGRRIAGIAENTTPLAQGPFEVEAPSQYVLEVNGRFCREHGIAAGDRVLWDGL